MELLPRNIARQGSLDEARTRTFSWSELIARLEAERDLRALSKPRLPLADHGGEGSFDSVAARHLARRRKRDKSEWRVNRDGLTPEKPAAAIADGTAQCPANKNRDAR